MHVSFNRVILFVQDVTYLKSFYQQRFQFEPLEEITDEWVILNAGACELAFHKAGPVGHGVDGAFNNVKLVFEITSDLTMLRDELVLNNVPMKEIKSFAGIPYLFCDGIDPEGNVFQLMQKVG